MRNIEVRGLTCHGCVETVTTQLTGVPGVEHVEIDLRAGEVSTVSVTADREIEDDELQAALSQGGAFTLVR